jgi:hypothetical protein
MRVSVTTKPHRKPPVVLNVLEVGEKQKNATARSVAAFWRSVQMVLDFFHSLVGVRIHG